MKPCPNCNTLLAESTGICPNCGAALQPLGGLITKFIWLDILLGALAGFGSIFLYGIGIIIPMILFFILRERYPCFARGLAIALFTVLALLLGAFLWCMGALFLFSRHS